MRSVGVRFAVTGHQDIVTCVAASPNRKWIASGDLSHQVFLWNADNGKQLAHRETFHQGGHGTGIYLMR